MQCSYLCLESLFLAKLTTSSLVHRVTVVVTYFDFFFKFNVVFNALKSSKLAYIKYLNILRKFKNHKISVTISSSFFNKAITFGFFSSKKKLSSNKHRKMRHMYDETKNMFTPRKNKNVYLESYLGK